MCILYSPLYRPGFPRFSDITLYFPRSQGLIDTEKELAKLTAKKGDLERQMEKLNEKMEKSDYKEKVPAKVQEQDAEKVSGGNHFLFAVMVKLVLFLGLHSNHNSFV